jgi:hypothetical protein
MKLRAIHPLWYLLSIPLLSLIYVLINKPPSTVYSMATDLDGLIPFSAPFVAAYGIWMPFVYLSLLYFYRVDRTLYFRTLTAYVISVSICYVIYLVFQTTVARPILDPAATGLWTTLVRFIYENDGPYNCFPSIHCLSSYLLFRAAQTSGRMRRGTVILFGVIAWSIIVSTVFIKQHVVMDAVAGIALAHVVYALVRRAVNPGAAVASRAPGTTSASTSPSEVGG